MTALQEYQRLESPGIWRPGGDAQRRDVIVSFGEASLVISDNNDVALAHWSLAALVRRNPGKGHPAIYTPEGEDADEELEIEDPEMVEAITRVLTAIEKSRPHHGRLRGLLMAGGVAAVVGLAVFWLPNALRQHTARVVPDPVRTELGDRMLAQIGRVSGSACRVPQGMAALRRLTAKLPGGSRDITVLPAGVTVSAHLPDGRILLNRAVVEDYEEPEIVAGFILAEQARANTRDPMLALLSQSSIWATLRLLTTGEMPEDSLSQYAEILVSAPMESPPADALLTLFTQAGIAASPYAFAVDPSGETVLDLIEADPGATKDATALISDGDWITLQGICGE
ncbi:hypothetical protein ACMU_15770 [Actibacterium mucosum KCTC 23349]|uniref:Uncharacterized protein n=1 Tax=Actibacterium mucosum KCTC 23349 TaxID=1454373 RepID=A0A037ZI31_9RHOB|nr:hypothetical protein [Actibacterium mucosum]KAJ55212.1 hypothetical protein ACMU_15770 [Actibacterium mucosum KCTC 23349]